MNTLKKMLTSLLASVMLVGCASEDIVESPAAAPNGKGNIHFRLGGSAAPRTTRADETTLSTEAERKIDNLFAMVWTDLGEYIGLVDAVPSGTPGEYDMAIEKDGNYRALFVANADINTRQSLDDLGKNTPITMSVDPIYTALRVLAVNQPLPNKTNPTIIMTSTGMSNFSSSIHTTVNIGTVTLSRKIARFDFVNLADNITIKKITFKNQAVTAGLLATAATYDPKADWFKDEVYDNLEIIGNSNPDEAGKYQNQIYSWPNFSTLEKGQLPSFIIEYEEIEDGVKVNRKHTVELNDPDANGKVPLAIKDNYLYSITLRKGQNVDFELSVNDWNNDNESFESSSIKITDLDIDSDTQNELNSQLMVNMFTDYNVKSLNLSTKQAELFDHLSTDISEYSEDSNGAWFSYEQLKNNGLTAKDAIIADKNNSNLKYRLPTAGELGLLVPLDLDIIYKDYMPDESYDKQRVHATLCLMTSKFNYISQVGIASGRAFDWIETVAFENHDDGKIFKASEVVNDENGLISEIHWTVGHKDLKYNYCDANANYCDANQATNTYTYFPLYAVRFKGTKQYAAYKYEHIFDNDDPSKMYVSIKIKAIPENLDVSVFDVRDNDEYWSKDFKEFRFPCLGIINANNQHTQGMYARFPSSSIAQTTNTHIFGICVSNRMIGYMSSNNTSKMPLRLVKVEE